MSDPSPLLAAADRLADRFRSMPQNRLTALAPSGLDLARRLARQAQQVEGDIVRDEIPEAGIFAVGDQIAVAAHDLAAALRAVDGAESEQALADSLAAVRAVAAL
ncbi:hypothetical protein ABIA33_001099 [Streptacidiphilus sp. MAP12-16]|uniref:hypothetical protein n=1 Tax=Streptacidiphilus sp. MAP12-16 TaxID=3156300 RepID=UPI003519766B